MMDVEGRRRKGRHTRRWMYIVNVDLREKRLSREETQTEMCGGNFSNTSIMFRSGKRRDGSRERGQVIICQTNFRKFLFNLTYTWIHNVHDIIVICKSYRSFANTYILTLLNTPTNNWHMQTLENVLSRDTLRCSPLYSFGLCRLLRNWFYAISQRTIAFLSSFWSPNYATTLHSLINNYYYDWIRRSLLESMSINHAL